MREAVGPDVDIMIDVNMGWSADTAILMGRKFEEYDVYWLEEPVLADDYAGYLRCAEALDLRIVGGETHCRATTSSPSSRTRACRSCSPTRCAGASPSCARSPPSPTPGA